MSRSFRTVCEQLRRPHARACLCRAMLCNRLAHSAVVVGGRQEFFNMKTRSVEQAIRLAPEGFYVDDFRLHGGGLVGITGLDGLRFHVKLGDLADDTQAFVWDQIRRQCSPPSRPAA